MSVEPGHVFEKRFTNRLEDLGCATDEAVRFLEQSGVDAKSVNLANLVIEEIATNILKYGYDDAAPHEILLRVQCSPDRVLVVLEDDGHEFNPLTAPPPDLNLPVEKREAGGLGIHLVRQLATQMDYQRRNGRNRLTVRIST